jgi:hypothetical protein
MLFLSFDEALGLGNHVDEVAISNKTADGHKQHIDACRELFRGDLFVSDCHREIAQGLERLAVDLVLEDRYATHARLT